MIELNFDQSVIYILTLFFFFYYYYINNAGNMTHCATGGMDYAPRWRIFSLLSHPNYISSTTLRLKQLSFITPTLWVSQEIILGRNY